MGDQSYRQFLEEYQCGRWKAFIRGNDDQTKNEGLARRLKELEKNLEAHEKKVGQEA